MSRPSSPLSARQWAEGWGGLYPAGQTAPHPPVAAPRPPKTAPPPPPAGGARARSLIFEFGAAVALKGQGGGTKLPPSRVGGGVC
jgi:hypothetical protein